MKWGFFLIENSKSTVLHTSCSTVFNKYSYILFYKYVTNISPISQHHLVPDHVTIGTTDRVFRMNCTYTMFSESFLVLD